MAALLQNFLNQHRLDVIPQVTFGNVLLRDKGCLR
jgi:hypothetical protein